MVTANAELKVPGTARHTAALAAMGDTQAELIREALEANLDFIPNDLFKTAGAERELFDDGMAIAPASTSWYHPLLDSQQIFVAGASSNVLSGPQEVHLFLRYNYARMRAQAAAQRFRTHPGQRVARDLAQWYTRVKATRAIIAQANLALVLAMVKRTRTSEMDFGDLVSEGNMALLRAVEKFDAARGFKFSTYACRAILKAFSRVAVSSLRYRNAFPAEYDPTMEKSNYQETRRADIEQDAVEELRRIVDENRAQLTEVEHRVIEARFGISSRQDRQAMTLAGVGQLIGVTKERVRQIQNKALEKLRLTIESEVLVR